VKLTAIRHFLHNEASGGIVLLAASVAALVWANSAAAPLYQGLLHLPVGLHAGAQGL
jgi:NhaA family Na+:H+ antiporter